jgi:hypothetical protein
MTLAVPAEWRARTVLGRVLANTEATATFRWTSGAPYTRIRNNGDGYTVGASPLEFSNIEPINASNLPWTKTVDVRVTRGFTLGRVRGRVFAESQNLFNWTNLLNLFIETGETTNPQYRARFVDEQVANLENQAANAGWLRTDGSGANYIDFTAGCCADWRGRNTQGSAASGPVDCVLLTRAEARFGNGDGVYTRAEYSSAFGAWYDLAQAPYQFYGPGRRIRLGVAIAF